MIQRKGNPHVVLVGRHIGLATIEKCMKIPKKTKTKKPQPYGTAILFLGIYSKKNKTLFYRDL